ncbi:MULTISPECIES: hypothetical protein [Nostoc]|uniref:Transposase n=1 Tax=Nostoc paludosum FACHB-159 TaxID=2692908 RepID=A0ABR8KGV4_9NOSO|nr:MULTISPECIES: hypothetical protein [Nostoc]MBD2682403.1 hypothetical protein [Nostoc sp. FACHB-857]MBD2738771.1 hypothetical protein [Nostoc paludosum FACHB-159]
MILEITLYLFHRCKRFAPVLEQKLCHSLSKIAQSFKVQKIPINQTQPNNLDTDIQSQTDTQSYSSTKAGNWISLVGRTRKQPSGLEPFELKGKIKSFSYVRHLTDGNLFNRSLIAVT